MPRAGRPSLALDEFTRIIEAPDPVVYLRSKVDPSNPWFEAEHLEFKSFPWKDFKDPMQGCDPKNLKDPAKDFIKETWSQALSGFANTSGGVLIWGIHAKKNENGIDAAETYQLVPSPGALTTRLMELNHQATDPPVIGVDIRSYPDPTEAGKGFVVCYVPESLYAPHRAEHSGQRFYTRALDDFVVAPVSTLRRLFYPQSQPWLEITTTLEYIREGSGLDSRMMMRCGGIIRNSGSATARNIHVGLSPNRMFWKENVTVWPSNPWRRIDSPAYEFAFAHHGDLHPGFSSTLFFISEWGVRQEPRIVENSVRMYMPRFDEISISFSIFAENFEPKLTRVSFSELEFTGETKKLEKTGPLEDLR